MPPALVKTYHRIVIILPCCIGDVVMATAVLSALRRQYPNAHITWAVGSWSKAVLIGHPYVDDLLDTGPEANPAKSVRGLWRLARQLRAGQFDLAVSLSRSPAISAAVALSGIPTRAGLDSRGRGFGYSVRVPVDPFAPEHEVDIYLRAVKALGVDVENAVPFYQVSEADQAFIQAQITAWDDARPYLVVNPAGGRNPGMTMDHKRYPPQQLAQIAQHVADDINAQIVVVAGPQDTALIESVSRALPNPPRTFGGTLSFGQIAGLAKYSMLYLGNDTGLTHLAAASGAPTAMILGPTDPRRYRPYNLNSVVLWKPTALPEGGVSSGIPADWDWAHDGISVEASVEKIIHFLQ